MSNQTDENSKFIPGSFGGREILKVRTPHYKKNAKDLKYLRDKIKYSKTWPNDVAVVNNGMIVELVQLEWAWLEKVKDVALRGTCGPHERNSYHWIFYIWALFLQTRDGNAEAYWQKCLQKNPDIDISQFYAEETPGDYTNKFMEWFISIVRSTTPEVKEQLHRKLFHKLGEEYNEEMFGPDVMSEGMGVDQLMEAFRKIDLESVKKEEKDAANAMDIDG